MTAQNLVLDLFLTESMASCFGSLSRALLLNPHNDNHSFVKTMSGCNVQLLSGNYGVETNPTLDLQWDLLRPPAALGDEPDALNNQQK